jgi:hypothetical protein
MVSEASRSMLIGDSKRRSSSVIRIRSAEVRVSGSKCLGMQDGPDDHIARSRGSGTLSGGCSSGGRPNCRVPGPRRPARRDCRKPVMELTLRLLAAKAHGALAPLREALAAWSQEGFHIQHFYALRLEIYADLYDSEPERANDGSNMRGARSNAITCCVLRFPGWTPTSCVPGGTVPGGRRVPKSRQVVVGVRARCETYRGVPIWRRGIARGGSSSGNESSPRRARECFA